MKKLISIFFLLFFVYTGNAQENNKSKWSELNQDQLNFALTKSKKTIKTGKIITYSGLGVAVIGTGTALVGLMALNSTAAVGGVAMVLGLMTTMYIGIPVWIAGAARKKNITLELVKYYPTGSASINGIGLKIRF
jgi:Flp pilus assembly protein TadB